MFSDEEPLQSFFHLWFFWQRLCIWQTWKCERVSSFSSWLCCCRSRCGSKTVGPNRRRTPPRTQTNAPPLRPNHWPPATSCASWSRGASLRAPPRHQTPSWGLRTRQTAPCWAALVVAPPPPLASAATLLPAPYQGGLLGCRCPRWAAPHPHHGWVFLHHTPSASPCLCLGARIMNWHPPTAAGPRLLSRTCGWTGRRQIWVGRRQFLKWYVLILGHQGTGSCICKSFFSSVSHPAARLTLKQLMRLQTGERLHPGSWEMWIRKRLSLWRHFVPQHCLAHWHKMVKRMWCDREWWYHSEKTTCEFLQQCRVCMLSEPWQTDVFIATLFAVVLSDSSLLSSEFVRVVSLYKGLHLLFRKKKNLTWIVQTESVSEWAVLQREQFVHISVHIPVQEAMFDFSLCAITIWKKHTQKKKKKES